MKKSVLILALVFVMMFAVAAVSAQEAASEEPAGFKVTYNANECLAEVPTDETAYAAGDEVTVLFEPVQYKDYLIFYGWDIDDDGVADFGYNYDKFQMPEEDVELKAICVGAAWGGSTCKGCHLHGTPRPIQLNVFDYEPYY